MTSRIPVSISLVLALVSVWAFHRYFDVAVNLSDSLPGKVYLVLKWDVPGRGEVGQFRYSSDAFYRRGSRFLKLVAAVEGDTVAREGRQYTAGFTTIGVAKERSRAGIPLEPGPIGVLPAGKYFMYSPSPDSFDSRYAAVGWVDRAQIIGRAVRIL